MCLMPYNGIIDDREPTTADESFVAYPRQVTGWTPKEIDRFKGSLVPWAATSLFGVAAVVVSGQVVESPQAVVAGMFFLIRLVLVITQFAGNGHLRGTTKAFALATMMLPPAVLAFGLMGDRSIATVMLALPIALDAIAAWLAFRAMRRADKLDIPKLPG